MDNPLNQEYKEFDVLGSKPQSLWKDVLRIAVILGVSLMLTGCTQAGLITKILRAAPAAESHTLIKDDFSDKDSEWGQFIYREGSATYQKGAYQIAVNVPNSDIFITYPRVYINSIVEVDVNKVSGSNDNNFGLICRYEDEKNFYAGQISSDGFAGIMKVKNGIYQLIGREQMIPVPAILGGEAVNHLKFECIQNTLTLTVNGEVADEQRDDAFISGESGMIAGTISGYEGVFRFDNFTADVR